ncbi:hypothetical protein Tco_0686973 [Tanacetum coccineum]
MTLGTISSGLVQNFPFLTPANPPIKNDRDLLFQPMFDEYLKPPTNVDYPVPEVHAPVPAASTSLPSSTTIDQDAPSTIAHMENDPYFGLPIPKLNSEESSSRIIVPTNVHAVNQPQEHIG